MAIQFTIAKRGLLPSEEGDLKDLYPRLKASETVNVVEFQRKATWGSMLTHGALNYALDEVRRILLHELRNGKAVRLPGIGTFRPSLKGGIEVRNGHFYGKNVHVGGLLFQPDRELLQEVKCLEVSQEPAFGLVELTESDVEECLTELFAHQESVTRKTVFSALNGSLTNHRVTTLLQRLVEQGRLIAVGHGPQTSYRAAEGQFGS